MKIEYKIVGIFIAFGLFIWIMNALFVSSSFPGITFWEALSFDLPAQGMHAVVLIAASVIVFGIVIARLLAQRRRAEEELRESEGRYRNLFDELNDAVFLADTETGYVIDTNKRAEVLLGRAREEIIGMHQTELHPPEVTNGYRQRFAAHVEKGHMADYDGEVITKDGTIVPVNISAAPVTIAGRKLILGLFRDITERKRAEEVLRESQKRFRDLANLLPQTVWEIDTEGTFTFVNQAGLQSHGYTLEDVNVPLNTVQVFIPEDRDRMIENTLRILNGEDLGGIEYTALRKDSSTFPVIVYGSPVIHGNETVGLRGVTVDITERKQAEELFTTLASSSPVGIYIVQGGKFQFTNPQFQKYTGYSEDELLSMDSLSIVHAEDREEVRGNAVEMLKGNRLAPYEFRYIRKSGENIWAMETVASIQYQGKQATLGSFMDVTERKQAEEALKESEERYRAVLNLGGMVGEAIVMLQDKDGIDAIHVFISDEWPHMTGYATKELLGMSFLEILHPRYRESSQRRHRRKMKGEIIPGLFEMSIIKKDGTEVPIEVTSAYTTYQGERANVAFIRDITDRKQAEEREKQLQEELLLSSRLAAVGELAAGVAHEINNPLTGIMGFSQRLLRQSTDGEASRYLERIYSESKRVSRIVENLLTFARRRGREKEYADINDILGRALELRSYELKTGNIELEVELAPGLPRTMVDSQQTVQVFLNLILNAEQAMSEANRVGKLSVKTQQVKRNIRISFADNGPGIPAETLDRVFDPFFTTRGTRGGTGLGLSLCHGIVTEHGGRIYARSKPGEGSTFFVELPVIPGKG